MAGTVGPGRAAEGEFRRRIDWRQPMIKGVHHAAISVKDLDRSVAFYCDTLGMELLSKEDFSGQTMNQITRLPDTRGRGALLRAGAQHIELFEFTFPIPKAHDSARLVCDHGITHFCIEVSDIEAEYTRLRKEGVEFHCAPLPFGNMLATYARDPDGNIIELLEVRG